MFPWSRADFRHHVLRLVREHVPAIMEELHTIVDLSDPDEIRRDIDACATRWQLEKPWITRTMHRTVRRLAPGPGHAGQSAVGARVPENSWGHRRSWRRRTVPQYRGFKPTPTSQITEAEVFDWWERYHLRHEGYETIAGDPTRKAAVRIAVSRLAHALDRPLRKGRPGRPRTRQIGRSDAEFLRKSRDAFVLLFPPLRAASIGTGSSRDGHPTRPRTTAHRRDAGTRAGRRVLMTQTRTPSLDTYDERPRRSHSGTLGWDTNKRLIAGHVRERGSDHVNVPTAPGAGHEE